MHKDNYITLPPVVGERLKQAYDLCINARNGRIAVRDLAIFFDCSVDYLRKCIQFGKLPFAFSSGDQKRDVSFIDILPFYIWITGGARIVYVDGKNQNYEEA